MGKEGVEQLMGDDICKMTLMSSVDNDSAIFVITYSLIRLALRFASISPAIMPSSSSDLKFANIFPFVFHVFGKVKRIMNATKAISIIPISDS